MAARLSHFVLLALLTAGCTSPATQLVVLVDTDYDAPSELSDVRVVVEDDDGAEVSSTEFAVTRGVSMPPRFALPISFGLVPLDGDESRRILVRANGVAPDGRPLVERTARTGYLEGVTLLLPMFLSRRCESVVCPVEQTCDQGVCVGDTVDPEELVPITPGDELEAGIGPDTARDAGADAAPVDSGPIDTSLDAPAGARFERSLGSTANCGMGTSTMVTVAGAVPAGDTLAVSVFYRDSPGGGIGATDVRGNAYVVVDSRTTNNPLGGLMVAEVTTALSPGDAITVTHPDAAVVSVVADHLTGVTSTPIASDVTQTRDSAVTSSIDTPSPSLVYAAHANMNNVTFSTSGPFVAGADAPASCAGLFGTVDHRTYHLVSDAGTHTLTGTYVRREQHLTVMAAFATE